jgi:hypothetical protein
MHRQELEEIKFAKPGWYRRREFVLQITNENQENEIKKS